MGFNDFLAAIKSPELRDIAKHWNTARGTKRMPGWKDIDPTAIARHLSIAWSWRYDPDIETFTGRLAGEKINEAFGDSLRGKRMQDFFSPESYEIIFPRCRRVVTEPAFALDSGRVHAYVQRYSLGERIIMPLATDGMHGDGIFGATIYTTNPDASQDTVVTKDLPETVHQTFFPLD
jgi:hypothetical protein